MRRVLLACVALAGLWGCASDIDHTNDPDGDDPPGDVTSKTRLREPWDPPRSTIRGMYDEAGAWNDGRACAGGLTRGAKAIADRIRNGFTVDAIDSYDCRPSSKDSSVLSIHGTGRALDVFAGAASGDQVAKWLVLNAEELGIQLVIWNRTVWKVTPAGPISREYAGANPHTSHVHAELTRQAAAR